MNLNLSSAVRATKSVITANSPVLLVGTAVVGVITTGVLAAKGGYKARGVIDAVREESGVEPTPMEKAKLTWLCYAVPAVTGASTIASVLGVHLIHNKRHAALATLYAVTSTKLDDYREEAEQLLGPKKSQQLNDAVAQKGLDRMEEDGKLSHELVITGPGEVLCVDELSQRPFMGSVPIIEQAFAELNLQLAESGSASLNDFYGFLGLEAVPLASKYGWDGSERKGVPIRVSPRFGVTTAKDGRAAKSFRFDTEPKIL